MRSILPDGKRIHYTRISPGTHWTDAVYEHTSPTAFYKSRVAWNGHGWDLTLKDGTVYVFGVETPLEAIRGRFGNTIRLTWSETNMFGSGYGNILRVALDTGRSIDFTYDAFDRVTEAKDHIGRTVQHEYDAAGRLWKVTDARGGVTEYTYDIAHRMLTISASGRGERAKRVEPQRAGVRPRERQGSPTEHRLPRERVRRGRPRDPADAGAPTRSPPTRPRRTPGSCPSLIDRRAYLPIREPGL